VARVVVLASLVASTSVFASDGDPCMDRGVAIQVDTQAGILRLCRANATYKQFPVAVGSGGRGKGAEGDQKTPLGRYALGSPRASAKFHLFIPVCYPTAEQRRQGATGGDVGVHGPKRGLRWAGKANTWLNWTRGCIAVASDEAIAEIAAWVRREKPAWIHLE